MRVLIETNILFSAALYLNSVPQRAFEKAVSLPNIGIVSYQSLLTHILYFYIFVEKYYASVFLFNRGIDNYKYIFLTPLSNNIEPAQIYVPRPSQKNYTCRCYL